jgi:hypothetical protein
MESLNAKELMDEMKLIPTNEKHKHRDYIIVMKKYIANYNRVALMRIISKGDKQLLEKLSGMQMGDINNRVETMRTMLSIVVPSIFSMLCVAFYIDNYNFAYVYFVVSDDIKPLFVSVGGNMISADGEWRPHICDIGAYKLLIGRYAKEIEQIYETAGATNNVKYNMFYSHGLGLMEEKVRKIIDVEKYTMYLYALALFSGKHKPLQNHMSPGFISFIGDEKMPEIDAATASDMFSLLSSSCGCIYKDPKLPTQYRIVNTGQKFVLLTPGAVSHPLDNSESVWNELQTMRQTTDLVLNMITPCFAIHGTWFFVYNANKDLFNVAAAHEKIALSETIQMTPGDMRTDLIFSDVAINVINENAGLTFLNNFPTSNAPRYLFDILFALLMMNTKLGKMHGDLHGNNVVLAKRSDADGFVVYELSGDTYVLPHTGSYSCIIDFSRVVNVGDAKLIETAVHKYEIHFPQWTKTNIDKLMERASTALDGDIIPFAKVVSAFDAYELCVSLLSHVKDMGDAKSVFVKCKEKAVEVLMGVLTSADDSDWANLQMIKSMNKPAADLPNAQKIWGYYADNNKMQYSTARFADLPPMFSSAPMIAHEGDTPVDTHSSLTMLIKSKYLFQESEESILRGVGM